MAPERNSSMALNRHAEEPLALLKTRYDCLLDEGFDELGALVNVIDDYSPEERFSPTIELLESLGLERIKTDDVGLGEYSIKTAAGKNSEAALRAFFVRFKLDRYLIQYQPLNRLILRGESCLPHRPESDFRFADWYPIKRNPAKERAGKIEDQLADDFPNAAMAGQFLHDHGFKRSNTHKRLNQNTYFVAARQGDAQPSGIVFRGEGQTFFFDYYADTRYLMGASGLLKNEQPTKRQATLAASIAMMNFPEIPDRS